MAENVKALRRRLRSIRGTRQITRAMEMVSAAKLRKVQNMLVAARPYTVQMHNAVANLLSCEEESHLLMVRRTVQKRLLVLITADRGLAGAFNSQVLKRAESMLHESPKPCELVCVGKKGSDYFSHRSRPIRFALNTLGSAGPTECATELSKRLLELYLRGEVDEILVLGNSFVTTLTYKQSVEQILPIDREILLAEWRQLEPAGRLLDYILEPGRQAVLDALLPRYFRSRLYLALVDSLTAEHSARMVAMTGATRNCDELADSVSLRMNKARQSAITKEILEIVAGADALKG